VLTIEIKVNGNLIGGATVKNLSALNDVSDYEVTAVEKAEESVGVKDDFRETFQVKNHLRCQSVWALALRIAGEAFERQKENGQAITASEIEEVPHAS
jgi:hypothetical protein